MPCTLTLSVLTESQKGVIGNDWRYNLSAKVYSGALTGQGSVEVPKHNLKSGTTQAPPTAPVSVVIPAGEPGAETKVVLQLEATEVDLLVNDVGQKSIDLNFTNPMPGAASIVEEREISVGVTESPSGLGNAIFTLTIRIEIANV